MRIGNAVVVDLALERRQRDALGAFRPVGIRRDLLGARRHGVFPFRVRHHLVDQPPLDRLRAAHALLDRAEDVGAVAPHLALVGDAGEPAGAGQHRQQRRLRQRHRRAAVVDQHDVIGGERELVAAAGRIAVDGADVDLLGVLRGVLDRQPRLVGELAEVHLGAVRRLAEHADIGAGAEHVVLARLDDDAAHLRMLEAQPLHRVVQLDVDAEVVGIELELVVAEPAGLVDVHDQVGDVAVVLDAPVPIARGVGLVVDHVRHASGLTCVMPGRPGRPTYSAALRTMDRRAMRPRNDVLGAHALSCIRITPRRRAHNRAHNGLVSPPYCSAL